MTQNMTRKIVQHSSTLEKIERYRAALLRGLSVPQLKKELKFTETVYRKIKIAYKQIYYNEEAISLRRDETLEKLNVVKKKAFKDYLQDAIPVRDFVALDKHSQETDARFGLAPSQKLNISHSFSKEEVTDSIKKILERDLLEDQSE